MTHPDLKHVESLITAIPDFPKKGILFRDIFPIFQDPVAVESIISHIVSHIFTLPVRPDVVVGLDARGFLFGPMIAARLNAAFVPVRKKGKLPGVTMTASYEKEYGLDELEIQLYAIRDGQHVIVIDDLIATGGTAKAAGDLIGMAGGKILSYIFVIELAELMGKNMLKAPVYSLIKY